MTGRWLGIALLSFGFTATLPGAEESVRQWRNADGKSVLGRLISADDKNAVIEVKGKEFTLRVASLSEEDRKYISAWRDRRHDAPPMAGKSRRAPPGPWPKFYEGRTKAKFEKLDEPSQMSGFHCYRTARYDYAFQREISRKQLDEIAAVFESVSGAMEALPLRQLHPSDWQSDRRFQAVFLTDGRSYGQAGGPAGSVGVFDMRSRRILIRLDGLFTPQTGKRLAMPPRERYRVLVHELVHQVMFPQSLRMPLWYTEGIAEYMSVAQFAPARFDFRNLPHLVREHVRRHVTFEEDGTLELPSVAEVVGMDHRKWQEHNRLAPILAFKKYVTALLLAHYFHHVDGSRAARLGAFLDACASRRPPNDLFEKHLLHGRSMEELGEAIRKYWDTQGLKIRFK